MERLMELETLSTTSFTSRITSSQPRSFNTSIALATLIWETRNSEKVMELLQVQQSHSTMEILQTWWLCQVFIIQVQLTVWWTILPWLWTQTVSCKASTATIPRLACMTPTPTFRTSKEIGLQDKVKTQWCKTTWWVPTIQYITLIRWDISTTRQWKWTKTTT